MSDPNAQGSHPPWGEPEPEEGTVPEEGTESGTEPEPEPEPAASPEEG
jgi:hypothetical protein